MPLKYVDAEARFLEKLKGASEPEQKRKIIGHEFIEVFDEAASEISDVKFLAQGTTYPDGDRKRFDRRQSERGHQKPS